MADMHWCFYIAVG